MGSRVHLQVGLRAVGSQSRWGACPHCLLCLKGRAGSRPTLLASGVKGEVSGRRQRFCGATGHGQQPEPAGEPAHITRAQRQPRLRDT